MKKESMAKEGLPFHEGPIQPAESLAALTLLQRELDSRYSDSRKYKITRQKFTLASLVPHFVNTVKVIS